MDSGQAPPEYVDYKLKEKFGWTQSELNQESAHDINCYLKIMEYEHQRQKNDNG